MEINMQWKLKDTRTLLKLVPDESAIRREFNPGGRMSHALNKS
jgi:hypothetical protein